MKPGWIRYKWQETCIVCGHGGTRGHCSGCVYSGPVDAPAYVLCLREQKGAIKAARNGMGWVHAVNVTTPKPRYRPAATDAPPVDPEMQKLSARCESALDDEGVAFLASELGVSEASLRRLGCGWMAEQHAYSFPMRNEANLVIGIRLRDQQGRKWSVKGSVNGLFIPRKLPASGTIHVVEGPTDTAAMLTLDLHCIGRPSNTAGNDYFVRYCKMFWPRREVVIVQNNDPVGSRAEQLTIHGAKTLQALLSSERAASSVTLTSPPDSIKDVRECLRQGLYPLANSTIDI